MELTKGFLSKKLQKIIDDEEKIELETNPILKQKLMDLIDLQKIYKKENISIKEIAINLNEHEYKIRKLINYELGYRNFNEFINHYRIKDICEILSDEKLIFERMSITRIALDMGYGSLASFNRAFRSITGITPTEFRKKRIIEISNESEK